MTRGAHQGAEKRLSIVLVRAHSYSGEVSIRLAGTSPFVALVRAHSYSLHTPLNEVVMIASVYTRVYNSVHVGTQLYTHVYTKQHTLRAQKLYL